jgi:hypothetical protein
MPLRRRFATMVVGTALAIALGAAPALGAGSPLVHGSYPATVLNEEELLCGYTFATGTISVVYRAADFDPETGAIAAAHVSLHDVWATRAKQDFHVLGSETYSDVAGRLTEKLFFVAPGGGLADSINVVFRLWADGSVHFGFERDSCQVYVGA